MLEMESFDATLQEMIDRDMRAHFDSLTPSSLEPDAVDTFDASPWSQPTHHQLVYSDLENAGVFVNPQTALPHGSNTSNLITTDEREVYTSMVDEECLSKSKLEENVMIYPKLVKGYSTEIEEDARFKGNIGGSKEYPKPAYSYSCLIAMALKNSQSGCLPVSEIYGFMIENFPYFKTAPAGWKNSVRHNLSLNKCFEKVDKSCSSPNACGNNQKKGWLWTMNPSKINKMNEEVQKWIRKDPLAIKRSMAKPEKLEMLSLGFQQENLLSKKEIEIGSTDQLDVSLPDLNLQTGIWDELESEINLNTNANILHLTNNNVDDHRKDDITSVRGSL